MVAVVDVRASCANNTNAAKPTAALGVLANLDIVLGLGSAVTQLGAAFEG
jgi:hypothetical protein